MMHINGTVLALTVLAWAPAAQAQPSPEQEAATTECLKWIDETYRIESMADELGLELSADYEATRACVAHDTRRMEPEVAVAACDSVFKVHCPGLDLLTEIGDALVERCEKLLAGSLGVRLQDHKGWTTCGQHAVFDRYSRHGEASDKAACRAALLACGTDAGETAVDAVADAYLAAIQTQDWARMAEFLTAESHYQDFTMEYFDRPPIDLRGAGAIVEFWRESSQGAGTQDIRYDVRKRFTAGPNVILDIFVTVRNRGADWDLAVEEFEVSGTLITFLRILDGKVVHHMDFVDYAAAFGQIEELRARSE